MTLLTQIVALLRDSAVIVLAGLAAVLYRQVSQIKDAEINTLKARIAHLQAMSAPALVEENREISAGLDAYVARAKKLEQDLQQASAETATKIKAAQIGSTLAATMESLIILSRFVGFERGVAVLAGSEGVPVINVLDRLDEKLGEIEGTTRTALEGRMPNFPHLQRALAERKVKQ